MLCVCADPLCVDALPPADRTEWTRMCLIHSHTYTTLIPLCCAEGGVQLMPGVFTPLGVPHGCACVAVRTQNPTIYHKNLMVRVLLVEGTRARVSDVCATHLLTPVAYCTDALGRVVVDDAPTAAQAHAPVQQWAPAVGKFTPPLPPPLNNSVCARRVTGRHRRHAAWLRIITLSELSYGVGVINVITLLELPY